MAGFLRKAVVTKNVIQKDNVTVVDGLVANRLMRNSRGKGPVRKVARYKVAANMLR